MAIDSEIVKMGSNKSSFGIFLQKWFDNKDKSLLIGQISATFLILILFGTVICGEEEIALGLSILLSGMAVGWVTGILLSPYQEYNNEATKFSRAIQVISTFVSGAIAAKLIPFITIIRIEDFFEDQFLLMRTLCFLTAFILTAILVYYDRTYPNLDEKGTFMTWCREIFPGQHLSIKTETLDTNFSITIENLGLSELHFRRSEKYDPEIPHFISNPNSFQTLFFSELGDTGSSIFVTNPSKINGNFKIKLSD